MNSCLYVDSVSDNHNSGYIPNQVLKAYGLKQAGNGINVGVIDFIGNPYIQKCLDVFSTTFGLPHTIIQESGKNISRSFNYNAYLEPVADVQWVHAISPYSGITVIKAPEYSFEGAISAIEYALSLKIDILLLSFQSEFRNEYLKYKNLFENKIIFVASAGDYGAQVNAPSCYSGCVSVGGTSLGIDIEGKRISEEIAWRFSGGGICSKIEIPEYQRNFPEIYMLGNGKRCVPDISFYADYAPGYSIYHSSAQDSYGWYTVGGTSLSAAVIAGVFANLLSQRKSEDRSRGFDVHRYLYSLAGETKYENKFNKFYDIVLGNNGIYFAYKGYDLCTGLGSVINS